LNEGRERRHPALIQLSPLTRRCTESRRPESLEWFGQRCELVVESALS
jgi:hypothetical protein